MFRTKALTFLYLLLFTSFLGYSQNTKENNINFTILDSTNQSSNLVTTELIKVGNKTFAYVAGENKTLQVYKISKEKKLDLLEEYQVTNKSGGIRALTHIPFKHSNLLLLGNKADNALEVYRIKSSGKLEKINTVYDTDSTFIDEIVTIHPIVLNNKTFIYAGGLDNGITCFEIKEDGTLYHVQSIEDNDSLFLHGIIGMTSLIIKNKTFLITGAFFDDGISSFEVMNNGYLKNVSNVKDDNKLFLNGTYPINSVKLGNNNFLLVGHRHKIYYTNQNAESNYHGDGINVFKIDAEGQITLQSLLKDNERSYLKGSTRIEIIKVNKNQAIVIIGTRDDKRIQVCLLKQDGILIPITSIDLEYPIYNGMTIKKDGDNWYLLAGAYKKNILELYSIYIK